MATKHQKPVSLAPAFISEDGPAELKIVHLRKGEQLAVRMLPWYADTKRPWARLCQHRWPYFEGCAYSIKAVCPKHTAPELLKFPNDDEGESLQCPACEAGIPIDQSLVVYASVRDKRGAVLLCLWDNWLNTMEELVRVGCFDLQSGKRIMLRNVQG